MDGPWHYREASLILVSDPCSYGCPHSGCPHEMAMIGRAIAHGLLANAAAVIAGARLQPADRHEWLKVTDPEYAAEQATGAAI